MQFFPIKWWLKRLKRGSVFPKYFVRLCRKPGQLTLIVNGAINSLDTEWNESLIDKVMQYLLEGCKSEISVYDISAFDALDPGHGLAVVAEGITQDSLKKTSSKRKMDARGCLIIPISCLPKTTKYKFSPENNLNFYPASDRHFDLYIDDGPELAKAILNGIRSGEIKFSTLNKENNGLELQVILAYSYCLSVYKELNDSCPPSGWEDGKDIVVSEQIEIMTFLVKEIKSKLESMK